MTSLRRFWILVFLGHFTATVALTYLFVPLYARMDGPPPHPFLMAIAPVARPIVLAFCFPTILMLDRMLVTHIMRPGVEYVLANSLLVSGLIALIYGVSRRLHARRKEDSK